MVRKNLDPIVRYRSNKDFLNGIEMYAFDLFLFDFDFSIIVFYITIT